MVYVQRNKQNHRPKRVTETGAIKLDDKDMVNIRMMAIGSSSVR